MNSDKKTTDLIIKNINIYLNFRNISKNLILLLKDYFIKLVDWKNVKFSLKFIYETATKNIVEQLKFEKLNIEKSTKKDFNEFLNKNMKIIKSSKVRIEIQANFQNDFKQFKFFIWKDYAIIKNEKENILLKLVEDKYIKTENLKVLQSLRNLSPKIICSISDFEKKQIKKLKQIRKLVFEDKKSFLKITEENSKLFDKKSLHSIKNNDIMLHNSEDLNLINKINLHNKFNLNNKQNKFNLNNKYRKL